jgi:hypothetical protein
MTTPAAGNVERRKEVFLALVAAQDQAMSVVQSHQLIMERFAFGN